MDVSEDRGEDHHRHPQIESTTMDRTLNVAELIAGFLAVVVVAAILAGLILLEALIVIDIWEWFIIPFFGLPAMTYPVAIGLCLLGTLLCPTPVIPKESKYEGWSWFGIVIFRLLMIWGIGFIASFWM